MSTYGHFCNVQCSLAIIILYVYKCMTYVMMCVLNTMLCIVYDDMYFIYGIIQYKGIAMLVYPLALYPCLTIVVYSSIVSIGLIWPYNPLVLYGLIVLSHCG